LKTLRILLLLPLLLAAAAYGADKYVLVEDFENEG